MQAGSMQSQSKAKAEQKQKRPAAGEIVLKTWKHAKRESEPKRWSRKGERTQGENPRLSKTCAVFRVQGAKEKREFTKRRKPGSERQAEGRARSRKAKRERDRGSRTTRIEEREAGAKRPRTKRRARQAGRTSKANPSVVKPSKVKPSESGIREAPGNPKFPVAIA